MDWIKRNLYFVIGSAVALLLLGGAGYYYYSTWKANTEVLGKLHEQYANLARLNSMNPHPGRPPESDNIKLAKEQEQQMRVAKKVKTVAVESHVADLEGPLMAWWPAPAELLEYDWFERFYE